MLLLVPSGPETPANLLISASGQLQDSGLWPGPGLFPDGLPPLHAPGGHQVGRDQFQGRIWQRIGPSLPTGEEMILDRDVLFKQCSWDGCGGQGDLPGQLPDRPVTYL